MDRNTETRTPGAEALSMTSADQLVRALKGADGQDLAARAAAARALGKTGNPAFVDALLSTLTDESVIATDVQTEIVMALGNLGDTRVADALKATLFDPDERLWEYTTQQEALYSLIRLGATETLREISEDPRIDAYYREQALEALRTPD
jgi:HEAT repeat protein